MPISQEQKIKLIDHMIRENNKKYLDQKSQIQYEKALAKFQQDKKRQILKQYTNKVKQGNRKAIDKKVKQQLEIKSKIKQKNIIKMKQNQQQNQKDITQTKPQIVKKQKMSEKQIQKIQKAIQVRAERHLQQMQLEKINKKLQNQRKKTRLYELSETCSRLVSKSSKRIPQISQSIPEQRRVLLAEYSKRAEEEIGKLDQVIGELISKSKRVNKIKQNKHLIYENSGNNNHYQVPQGSNVTNHCFKGQNQQQQDPIFTKSATELFQMNYIPINFNTSGKMSRKNF